MNITAMFVRAACLALVWSIASGAAEQEARRASGAHAVNAIHTLDIEAQPLADALKAFANQSGLQVMFFADVTADLSAPAVKGRFSCGRALAVLLKDTDLEYEYVGEQTISVRKRAIASPRGGLPDSRMRLAQAEGSQGPDAHSENERERDRLPTKVDSSREEGEQGQASIPEVLVTGSKILNMDIPRTEDDAQPYVVFDRETIRESGAANIEEFLKMRLTMNTTSGTNSQGISAFSGSTSSFNLRGLGPNQTLILVDGRRAPGMFTALNVVQQPDINGIPLAAVERIEVLPATASGIYGGGATGGVINVILRRDYQGMEFKGSYENSFDSDTADRRVDVGAGFELEGGRTSILVSGSYSSRNGLTIGDRAFTQRYRDRLLANTGGNFQSFNNALGHPPNGATTNIRSANGQNLTLKDGRALNSPITFVPVGYGGSATDAGAAFLANAGRYNLDWGNTRLNGAGGGLYSAPTLKAAAVTLRRRFASFLDGFVDLSGSDHRSESQFTNVSTNGFTIPATAPNNPFEQPIFVAVAIPTGEIATNETFHRRVSGGVIVRLPGAWTAEADHVWNQSRIRFSSPITGTSLTPLRAAITSGAIDVLRDTNVTQPDFASLINFVAQEATRPPVVTLEDSTIRAAGPFGSMWGGPIMLSGLVGHRREEISEGVAFNGNTIVTPSRSQSVDSAYLELQLPLVSQRNAVTAVHELEMQLAVRRDEYSTSGVTGQVVNPTPATFIGRATNKGSSTDPTIALRYQPVRDVTLRASYGTGFLPPSVTQLVPNAPFLNGSVTVFDPKRGSALQAYTGVAVISGGRADLKPEQSHSWSAGVVFEPRFAPRMRLSFDYTRIDKDDIIITLNSQQMVDNEDNLPGRITRGDNLPADPPGWAGVITGIDLTSVNLARALVRAFDAQLDYSTPSTRFGSFELSFNSTWQTHLKQRAVPTAPFFETVGYTSAGPLKFKANAQLIWDRDPWRVGWATRYFDSYFVYPQSSAPATIANLTRNQGNGGRISSQLYHDLFLRYRPFGRTDLTLGAKNVFDSDPPFDSANASAGYYSRFGDPRLATYYMSVRQSF